MTKDDDVYALGFNGSGCLGVGDQNSTMEPRKIEPLCQKKVKGKYELCFYTTFLPRLSHLIDQCCVIWKVLRCLLYLGHTLTNNKCASRYCFWERPTCSGIHREWGIVLLGSQWVLSVGERVNQPGPNTIPRYHTPAQQASHEDCSWVTPLSGTH